MTTDALSETSVPEQGCVLAPLRKGPLTSSHIAKWCAAQQNWDKIHYDLAYAREVSGLSGTIVNGALKQHLMTQFLAEAFDGRGWIWRLDFRFAGMDLVGHDLEVRGTVVGVTRHLGRAFVHVDVSIHNNDLDEATTVGTAIVVWPSDDRTRLLAELDAATPPGLRLDESPGEADPAVPDAIREKIGTRIEAVVSDYAIDLSRLRLFADAIGGLRPVHYDARSPDAKAAGSVLAPPLFPLHALEGMPGSRPLSVEREAIGREGVNEIGRDMRRLFGIEIAWNGGNKVEIHSLARVGERVAAHSTLVGAYSRVGRRGGHMLFFETLNRYSVLDGRPLVTERQTMVCRIKSDGGNKCS